MQPLGRSGFTLPSVLVGTLLSLMVAAAFVSFQHVQVTTVKREADRVAMQNSARNLVDLISAEIRQAGANPTCAANISAIADAKQSKLRIQQDIDGNGLLNGALEDVTYEYKFSSMRLDRSGGGFTDALAEDTDLSGSRVRYFDGNGVEVTAGFTGLSQAQRDNVRRIRIELVMARGSGANVLRASAAANINIRNRYFVNTVSCPVA